MQMLEGMMIFCWAYGCYNRENLHLIEKDILHYLNFGKISWSVGHLWTGHIRTWFSLTEPRHSLIFPLGLGTTTKFLYHSTVSSTSSGVMMSCCWSHSNASLKGFCGV